MSPGASGARKLVLCVIDGLPAHLLEDELSRRSLPALSALAERASYTRATSVFPSVTPVCLSSIATGARVADHGIPHITWYDRVADRIVDYGSSSRAVFAAGPLRPFRPRASRV